MPEVAFGRAKYISAPKQTSFSSNIGIEGYDRRIGINNVVRPYGGNTGPDAHSVRYAGLYNLLYKQYCVLGAKLRLKITPAMFSTETNAGGVGLYGIDRIRQDSNPATPSVYANYNPQGYFYIRIATYNSTGIIEGHSTAGPEDDIMTPIWAHPADFFNDRTVTWSRDYRRWYTGIEENVASDNTLLVRKRTLNTVTGGRNPSSYITFNYSAKKQFEIKEVVNVNSGHWANLAYDGAGNHIPQYRAYLQYGYVSFTDNGPVFRYPMDMPFYVTTEIDYYCAFRVPIEPHELEDNVTTLNAIRARVAEMPEDGFDVEEESDEEPFGDNVEDQLREAH